MRKEIKLLVNSRRKIPFSIAIRLNHLKKEDNFLSYSHTALSI